MTVAPIESPAEILFDDLEALPEIEAADRTNAQTVTTPAQTEAVVGSSASRKTAKRGAFAVTEAGITWQCLACDTVNPLEAQLCSVCGTSFADTIRPKPQRPERDPNMAALFSLFWPGAGHMYVGSWSQGIARAIISAWVLSVVAISALSGSGGRTTMVAVTFGVVATGLWLVGAHDAYREARGEIKQTLLRGKAFLYVVLGLLMLLFFLMLGAGLSARAG